MTAPTRPASEIASYDAVGQAELVRNGDVSPAELAMWAIERVEMLNPRLNAVVTPMFEQAAEQAKDLARGNPAAGPLTGVPYLVKDLVAEVQGVRFTEGSRFLRDLVSHYDSELIVRIRRAGLNILGKTATPEFGMVPTCESALFGATRNPWDPALSTSGSSGGSAAAVASGMVPAAHGNDLGGSIRYPASACGLFGLKPSRARIPLGPEYGDAVSGMAVEHALTRSVRDSAALLDAMAGPAPGDPYPAPPGPASFAAQAGADPGRLRIGYSAKTASGEPGHPDCLAALDDAARLCEQLGHEVTEADLSVLTPETGAAIGTVMNAATAWIVQYWVRRLGRYPAQDEIEPLTRAYWEAGQRVTAADYLLAVGDLQSFTRRVANVMTGLDLWLTPTLSAPPLPIGEIVSTAAEPMRALERGGRTVAYAGVIANITGNPAMSVPLWWNQDGIPVGVHFLGRPGAEATLFRLAGQLESARPWAHRYPPVHASAELGRIDDGAVARKRPD